jgi:NADP-reducing hydrogenase subunit HndD
MVKTYYAAKTGLHPENIYSVSVMPCTAKKFEAGRPEMQASGYRDVDAVLTTRELVKMIKQAGIRFTELGGSDFDEPLGESTGAAPIFGVTGGVMEAALRTAYEVITGKELPSLDFNMVRGLDGIKEAEIDIDGTKVKVAVVYGLANVHKVMTEIKEGKRQYQFVEIMTCPGGCMGGGGQPYPCGLTEPLDKALYQKRAQGLYKIDSDKKLRKSHENPQIKAIYNDFLGKPLGELSHRLLHTHYHARKPHGIASRVKDTVSI